MAKKKTKKKKSKHISRTRQATGIVLLLLSILLLIALVSHNGLDDRRIRGEIDSNVNLFDIQFRNQAGMIGAYLAFICTLLMGWLAFFLPIGLAISALRLFARKLSQRLRFAATLLFSIGLLGTMLFNVHLLIQRSLVVSNDITGGYIGEKSTLFSIKLFGELGSYVILGGFVVLIMILYTSVSGILSIRISLPDISIFRAVGKLLKSGFIWFFSFKWLVNLFKSQRSEEDKNYNQMESAEELKTPGDIPLPEESTEPDKSEDFEHSVKSQDTYSETAKKVQVETMDYSYPTVNLLIDNPQPESSIVEEELKFTSRMLKETLETFGVIVEGEIERFPGPVITRYEFKPGAGIKVSQIVNLSDDLALALKAKRIRIVAPIPGKAAVGVEIPNRKAQIVYLRDIIKSPQFSDANLQLPLALGKTTSGQPYVTDIAKLPHLLIAGATGSGKSVCINNIITSLMYRLHPHQIRFIMIDPKMLELTTYSNIPHLGRPVVTNPKRAEKVLADVVVEMESRYRTLANASVRNISDYNKKQESLENQLPYIVIIVDELADLMMSTNSSKTELLITRLAQMARAVGIHLVLATQRPSVDVITGLIKANFPARIAFQVSQKVDSRTIIDANGAEKLLGNGDMLFLYPGQPEPIRLHGAFLRNEETERIVGYIKEQGLPMLALKNISQNSGKTTDVEIDFGDPLFREACEVVIRHKQGSVSLLQRRLGIGYQRAARLIDKLEKAGIVSTFDGSKARDVLVDEVYINNLFQNAGQIPVTDGESN
ncbi:MAG: DNA translocase FtsK 4TM domain-containing protein [candidate division Zixibacteria bacterium]|nr:DNA translocase FtsK 4TM domain-containing protein [candidate division Zixibacteria bacterium]